MQIRQEIFDTYWRFATLRQEVFFKKINNLLPPWTSDPIINTYKFCNAYRASDRVSQYLIKNIIYDNSRSQNEEEVLFRILLFKIFNKIETWNYLENALGSYITLSSFNFNLYSQILKEAMNSGYAIYTSAYMSCASKEFGYDKKHQNHLALIDKMVFQDCAVTRIIKSKSLKEVFHIIQEYPLLGKFMAYQLAIDINYSEIINFDENSFTIAGPGAERGIGKCFVNIGNKTNADIIHWMVENQEQEFQRLDLNFQTLWGRPLQAIDCQNLFCETDKYCRQAFPQIISNRKKIKSKFVPNSLLIDYFYPPKWGINDMIIESKNKNQTILKLENNQLPSSETPNFKEKQKDLGRGKTGNTNYQQLFLEDKIIVNLLSETDKLNSEIEEKFPPLDKLENKNGINTKKRKSPQISEESFSQLNLF
ncbi:MAG: putative DNA base hypermodification protein [Nostoc sp. DedQUE08]|uniref:nucleotide kinase domain-containing protein n=1 Tax=Nostoc sp. DedQUE08 TaxID=3075393 RepID=UPI002AD1FF4D|nr:nucleotide kinase domain-containing protein [Nostoc sp. DedQUE08]MDZ8070426.1 putative DNA base hypermodification protein [Nostoc sp. DedQUE08]